MIRKLEMSSDNAVVLQKLQISFLNKSDEAARSKAHFIETKFPEGYKFFVSNAYLSQQKTMTFSHAAFKSAKIFQARLQQFLHENPNVKLALFEVITEKQPMRMYAYIEWKYESYPRSEKDVIQRLKKIYTPIMHAYIDKNFDFYKEALFTKASSSSENAKNRSLHLIFPRYAFNTFEDHKKFMTLLMSSLLEKEFNNIAEKVFNTSEEVFFIEKCDKVYKLKTFIDPAAYSKNQNMRMIGMHKLTDQGEYVCPLKPYDGDGLTRISKNINDYYITSLDGNEHMIDVSKMDVLLCHRLNKKYIWNIGLINCLCEEHRGDCDEISHLNKNNEKNPTYDFKVKCLTDWLCFAGKQTYINPENNVCPVCKPKHMPLLTIGDTKPTKFIDIAIQKGNEKEQQKLFVPIGEFDFEPNTVPFSIEDRIAHLHPDRAVDYDDWWRVISYFGYKGSKENNMEYYLAMAYKFSAQFSDKYQTRSEIERIFNAGAKKRYFRENKLDQWLKQDHPAYYTALLSVKKQTELTRWINNKYYNKVESNGYETDNVGILLDDIPFSDYILYYNLNMEVADEKEMKSDEYISKNIRIKNEIMQDMNRYVCVQKKKKPIIYRRIRTDELVTAADGKGKEYIKVSCYVRSSVSDFKTLFSEANITDKVIEATGKRKKAVINLAEYWKDNYLKPKTISNVICSPTTAYCKTVLNVWTGFDITKQMTEAMQWTDQLKKEYQRIEKFTLIHYFHNNEQHNKKYWQWWAHILQHPEIKQLTTIAVIGKEGSGKSFIPSKIMKAIIGNKAYLESGSLLTTDRFNAIVEPKKIIYLDEAIFPGDKSAEEALKRLIIAENIIFEEKNIPKREGTCFYDVYLTSNNDFIWPAYFQSEQCKGFVTEMGQGMIGWTREKKAKYYNANPMAIAKWLYEMDLSDYRHDEAPQDTLAIIKQKKRSLNTYRRYFYDMIVTGEMWLYHKNCFNNDQMVLETVPIENSSFRRSEIFSGFYEHNKHTDKYIRRDKFWDEWKNIFGTQLFAIKKGIEYVEIETRQQLLELFNANTGCKNLITPEDFEN